MSTATRSATTTECERILDEFEDLPTIPEVLVRIWRIVDDPDSSAADLERAVTLEPPLVARVLRLANSPYYGGRGGIGDVHAAIRQLGFATIRNLAVCLSVAGGLAGGKGSDTGMDRRRLWRHCVATAVIARRLASHTGLAAADEAFTAGLLHDLGKFVIALGAPTGYREIVRRAEAEEMSVRAAECAVIGADHATLGAAFAERWGFPGDLRAAIRDHHDEDSAGPLALIRVADQCAHALAGARVFEIEPEIGLEDVPWHALGVDGDAIEELRVTMSADIEAAQEFMNLV